MSFDDDEEPPKKDLELDYISFEVISCTSWGAIERYDYLSLYSALSSVFWFLTSDNIVGVRLDTVHHYRGGRQQRQKGELTYNELRRLHSLIIKEHESRDV